MAWLELRCADHPDDRITFDGDGDDVVVGIHRADDLPAEVVLDVDSMRRLADWAADWLGQR